MTLVIKSRVIAAAMSELGFTDKSSQPVKLPLPENLQNQSKICKLQYLHKAASLIVDKFVLDDHSVNRLLDQILTSQEAQDAINEQPRTADGRFPCRFPRCQHTFKYDGASRRRHEMNHNPLPVSSGDASSNASQPSSSTPRESSELTSSKDKPDDDVYNYSCALMADGSFFLNFLDAVSEGDGLRLMRQYKYMLLYCRADGHHSNKYSLSVSISHSASTPCCLQGTVKGLFGTGLLTTEEAEETTLHMT